MVWIMRNYQSKARVTRRVEEWKQKLVDLTKRNRLLYFRPSKTSTLLIEHPELQTIFERLVVKGRSWEFWLPPDEENQDSEDHLFKDDAIEPKETTETKPIKKNQLVCKEQDKNQIEKILKNLYRRATADYQEKGIRILHLAFGMLVWKEAETSEKVHSPIILVPVKLTRESAKDPFTLHLTEEADVVLNPALQVKLQNDFKIELPSLPEDWEENKLIDYFDSIEKSIKQLGWTVDYSVQLGLFSFHKLVMYQDLTTNTSLVEKHPIILALSDENIDNLVQDDLPNIRDLDTIQQPIKTFQILDADSSQQLCIQYALRGQSFVMQGPPGTGKSQTIANIIAECVANGKTVLFVSEKMAALEVVYQRIKAAGLADFCLELHSHKVNKREVVTEVARSFKEHRIPKITMTKLEFEKLTKYREKLNNYVLTLHSVREPLGLSVYEVISLLTKLEKIPFVPLKLPDPRTLTPNRIQALEELILQLQRVWKVATEGKEFPWRGFREAQFTLEVRSNLSELLGDLISLINRLKEESSQYATVIGVDTPLKLSDVEWLLKISELLIQNPVPHLNWITHPHIDSIIEEAKHYQDMCSFYLNTRDNLKERYSQTFFELPTGLPNQIKDKLDKTLEILAHDDEPKSSELLKYRKELLHLCKETQRLIKEWLRDANEIIQHLGLPDAKITIERIKQLARLALLCHTQTRPDQSWLDPSRLQEVRGIFAKIRDEYEQYNIEKQKLLQIYDESFFELELDRLIEHFSGIYRATIIKWFLPKFYRDKKNIIRTTRTGVIPLSIRDDLLSAREILRLKNKLEADRNYVSNILGQHYQGYNTDFKVIECSLDVANEALELAGVSPVPNKLSDSISIGKIPPSELRTIGTRLLNSISQWEQLSQTLISLFPLQNIPHTEIPVHHTPLLQFEQWLQELEIPLSALCNYIEQVFNTCYGELPTDFLTIIQDLQSLDKIREIKALITTESKRLQDEFGRRYSVMETAWDDVLTSLNWTRKVRELFGSRLIPEAFIDFVIKGAIPAPQNSTLNKIYSQTKELLSAFEDKFKTSSSIIEKPGFLTTAVEKLENHLKPLAPAYKGTSLHELTFELLKEGLQLFHSRIDDIQTWIDFKAIEKKFYEEKLHEFFSKLIKTPLLASQLSDVFRKSIYQAWIDGIFKEEPCLGEFRCQHHEQLIDEFRKLDNKLVSLSSQRVIEKANSLKPKDVIQAGESDILLKEAHKKRRHLPLRKLFEKIPNLLLRVKPCLMMSPISVSQFLNPEHLQFDLIIFDEASQICPEDAVGAIYRGKQLVVAGDNKQLPPTAFFQQAMLEEYDWDDISDEEFAIFDSILDACIPILPHQETLLRWHYRSKHESLIAFSNARFYENRLITFPSSLHEHETLGIKFHYVLDGVYDRGGKRDNSREAQVIADIVFEHFKKYPKKTLGVVTFSIAQMIAIEDEIERQLREKPEFERFFSEDRLEGFFVKNLENVQGDERDVIIFSIGYGKDQQGRMTMNFGPLNKDGGERRLNVAITRAREKVILVSSIKAADIDLNTVRAPGVLNLYKYLDYAERGKKSLELGFPVEEGGYESPLEEEVANEIKKIGYNVVPQVGCSGYRIDLGVLDPAKPGRFIIGVECDGASYHSAYTARDRDRLRQQVLESLGWRIHRIWSSEWVNRRETEVKRLKQVIESCRNNPSPPSTNTKPVTIPENNVQEIKVFGLDQINTLPGTTRYNFCELKPNNQVGPDFHSAEYRTEQCRLLEKLVEKEGPIHIDYATRRLVTAWGLGRIGTRIVEAVKEAVKLCERNGKLVIRGKFLWPPNLNAVPVRIPEDDDPNAFPRPIDYIPPEEIKNAIILIVKQTIGGIDVDSLLTTTARIFRFDRTSTNIQNKLQSVYKKMIRAGELSQNDSLVTLGTTTQCRFSLKIDR